MDSDGVAKPGRPGLWRQFGAVVYDWVVVLGLWMVATAVLLPFTGGEAVRAGQVWYSVYLLIVAFGYFGWCWSHGGQTLGMRSWRLRLVGNEGTRVGWGQALIRFLGAIVSGLALGAGFLWMLVDRERLTWHDRLSGTLIEEAG